jgi:putative flippase GtrA
MAIDRLVGFAVALLPAPLRRQATPARVAMLEDFIRFCCVGLVGLAIDIATVYGGRAALGLYAAGLLSYVIAATATWALNRAWTFRGHGGGPMHRQWGLFLLANGIGFVLNRGTYMLLIALVPVCAEYPILAILAGLGMGIGANFWLSRRVVFKKG